jgi:GH25 family lysozyme M1 (1,4-beta-N-acetylmuramidase)
MLKGIDISKHDGTIDFRKVKESGLTDFAVIRAGYGRLISQKDVKFEEFYKGCKENNIPVGAYWYSYAKSVSEIQTEARVFLEVIKGKQFEYPVYLDFEEKSQFALGKATCSAMAKAFLEILEDAGYYAGLYSSKSHLENYFSEEILTRYTVWVAHYGVQKTSYKYPYDIWQYSESGSVPGINHKCDLNYCYKEDFPEIIRKAGLNGFTKPVEKPVESVEKQKHRFEIFIDGERKYSGLLDD